MKTTPMFKKLRPYALEDLLEDGVLITHKSAKLTGLDMLIMHYLGGSTFYVYVLDPLRGWVEVDTFTNYHVADGTYANVDPYTVTRDYLQNTDFVELFEGLL